MRKTTNNLNYFKKIYHKKYDRKIRKENFVTIINWLIACTFYGSLVTATTIRVNIKFLSLKCINEILQIPKWFSKQCGHGKDINNVRLRFQ